jgi:hypothetical protein
LTIEALTIEDWRGNALASARFLVVARTIDNPQSVNRQSAFSNLQ